MDEINCNVIKTEGRGQMVSKFEKCMRTVVGLVWNFGKNVLKSLSSHSVTHLVVSNLPCYSKDFKLGLLSHGSLVFSEPIS
jgi:hypothetical protein